MFSYDLLVLVLIVNPELRSKLNDMFNYFFFWSIVGAQFANILTAFTIYFDFSAIHILQNIFHAVFTIFFACCLIQWTKAIAVKQNVSCIRFDRLSTEEFAAFSYIIPIFFSVRGLSIHLYELHWGVVVAGSQPDSPTSPHGNYLYSLYGSHL